MAVEDFKKILRKTKLGPGALWRKADFHVHMPGSSDYEYRGTDAVAQLGAELKKGNYAFAVILKHEAFPTREELNLLQAHCPDTTLIPGAEINVFVDALSKKVGKDYFFHCILAVDPEQPQEFSYVLSKAREKFSYRDGPYPAGFASGILDLGRFFRNEGALFIPAHLHQGKAPENSRSIDDVYDDDAFLQFVRDGAFDALEVRDPTTAKFFAGGLKTPAGQDIPGSVCVASSDAHHHEHIPGRSRNTWVRVEKKTFRELAAALSFPHRVSVVPPVISHPRILGLHVVGSFIPETWLALNESLNALIGAKGSGKTALLECMRFVLNTGVPPDRIESVNRHLTHVLGSAGYVECLVERENGKQAVLARRADSPERISITEADGTVKWHSASAGLSFPISILGWHEIEAVADKAEARINLLDRVGDPDIARNFQAKIREKIERARDNVPQLQRQIKKLDGLLRELWELQRKRATLSRLQEGEMLSLQNQYEWFLQTEQKIEALRNQSASRKKNISAVYKSGLTLALGVAPTPGAIGTAANAVATLDTALTAVTTSESGAASDVEAKLSGLDIAAELAGRAVLSSFGEFREKEYTPKVNQLPPEDRAILSKQIQVLEETKRLPIVQKQCDDLLDEVRKAAGELGAICGEICQLRESIASHRENLVKALNQELESVHLKFLRNSNQGARSTFQNRYGSEASSLFSWLGTFGTGDSYQSLKALFDTLASLQLDEKTWQVSDVFWNIKFVEFMDIIDDDDVELSLKVGNAGFVPVQNLSAGQRCVAVFPLLLRNTKAPLVIDQPEDNLDNRHIAQSIAPDLLKRKQTQQFLVTSHNANLVVLTDADLVVHVDSDGTSCRFPQAGFLACATSSVKESVVDVLDGGEAALAARQRKYRGRN